MSKYQTWNGIHVDSTCMYVGDLTLIFLTFKIAHKYYISKSARHGCKNAV